VPCARFEDLLKRCSAVVFAVPPPLQVEYATSAIRHGCALLLEKPIGGDAAGAEQLTTVALRQKAPTMALAWRHTEDVRRFLATDVSDVSDVDPVGGVGRVLASEPDGGAPAPPWRRARGVLRTYAADLFDLLEAALGPVVGMHARGDPRTWVGMSLDHSVGRFSEASLYGGRTRGTDVAFVGSAVRVGRRTWTRWAASAPAPISGWWPSSRAPWPTVDRTASASSTVSTCSGWSTRRRPTWSCTADAAGLKTPDRRHAVGAG
jgi:predicted dehydrogenase